VLIHGFGETGDMWSPMAAELAKNHTIVVPDLRAWACPRTPPVVTTSGRRPATSAPSSTSSASTRADIVAHDIGTMVAYAYAARYPDKTTRLVVIDSPIPGIPPWNQIVRLPALWHFNFGGPDAERLVAGRERNLPRSLLERVRGRPSRSTKRPPALRRDLRPARRECIPRSPSSSRSRPATRRSASGRRS